MAKTSNKEWDKENYEYDKLHNRKGASWASARLKYKGKKSPKKLVKV